LPSVYHDDVAVGQIVAEYFLNKGLRRFGVVAENKRYASQRCQGFQEVVSKAPGVLQFPALAISPWDSRDYARLEQTIRQWLKEYTSFGPLAVFATNDRISNIVSHAVYKIGRSVPDEVCLVGVDNSAVLTSAAPTSLSSVQLNSARQVALALEIGREEIERKIRDESPRLEMVPPIGVIERESSSIESWQDPAIAKALCFIKEHHTQAITVDQICRRAGVSRSVLEYKFRVMRGCTPKEALIMHRVLRAQDLLAESDDNMERVAEKVGFADARQLRMAFKAETGQAPIDFRHASRNLFSKFSPRRSPQ
jgi:LacI family transcriptional regulator